MLTGLDNDNPGLPRAPMPPSPSSASAAMPTGSDITDMHSAQIIDTLLSGGNSSNALTKSRQLPAWHILAGRCPYETCAPGV